MKHWKTLSRKKALDRGMFLSVEDHAVQLPDGKVIPDWTWIITPDFVNVMTELEDGRYLFFRQTKYAFGDEELLAPIGGFVDPGEKPLEAARRELMEEAGCEAREWIGLGSYRMDPNRGVALGHLFLARGARMIKKSSGGDLEEQHVLTLSLDEVRKVLDDGGFKVMAWAMLVAMSLRRLH